MSAWLRNASRRTLLATGVGLLVLVGGSTAIASAIDATPPAPTTLSQALQTLDRRPALPGLSARIVFNNKLLGDLASAGRGLGATDPLFGGGSGRLWVSADGQLRAELQSEGGGGDAQLVFNGTLMQLWHAAGNTMYSMEMTSAKPRRQTADRNPNRRGVERWLADLRQEWTLPDPQPVVLAGRPAYSLTASPKQPMGQLGALQIVWDAQYKLPLAVRLWSRTGGDPVIDIAASDAEFGPVDSRVLQMPLPAGAKQVRLSGKSGVKTSQRDSGPKPGLSLGAASALSGLTLPDGLQGQTFRGAWAGKDDQLMIAYGRDLNGWLLQVALPGKAAALPESVPLGSVDGKALVTPLGGAVSWQTAQHRYTLMGSHTRQELVAAATELVQ